MSPLFATPLYAAYIAVLVIALSVRVIATRRSCGVALGTGGNEPLERAVRAHANLLEYAPLGLLLLAIAELSGAHAVLLHGAGLTLIVGRTVHAVALPVKSGTARVVGMALTFTALGALTLACVWATVA